MLRLCDGKDLPSLPLHITLNTFVAFFTMLARAFFMIPIAECISQWKWIYYSSGARSLADFEVFDLASRGVWGSFGLLTKFRWRCVASCCDRQAF